MYEILVIIAIAVIAWHDVYRARFCEGAANYDFKKDRISKLIKLVAILLGCIIMWETTHNLYYALFPLAAWALLFDWLYYWFDGRELSLKYWWKHSEYYYWYLIIFKGEK